MKALTIFILFSTMVCAASSGSFRFAVIGDRTGSCVAGIFPEIIDEIKLFDPDFVMCVGDLIHGYTSDTLSLHAQWDTLIGMVEKLACPYYYVAGNHDINNEVDRAIYEARTGVKRYYSFDYANSHFIILDNTMTYWTPPQEMDEEQMQWLKNDLEKNKGAENIFVFYHIPTYLYALQSDTIEPLMELFDEYGVRTVFTGHHHQYSYYNRNATEYINVGSSGGGMDTQDFGRGHFYHYLFVTVRGTENNIAVIRKGGVFERNVLTASDLQTIARVDEEAVEIAPFTVSDDVRNVSYDVSARIHNFGTDSIVQPVKWDYDAARYTISPTDLSLHIASDAARQYSFTVTVHDGSQVFPIPRFAFLYPYTYGKSCTTYAYLPIKRLKKVMRVKTAPVIDGKLEAAWLKTVPITHYGRYDWQPDPLDDRTEVYLCHDADNLYIAARCFESDFSQLTAAATEHDGLTYQDDNLWFFFDTDMDQQTYYQAIINSNGAVFDRLCSFVNGQSNRDLSWNGPWDVKSGRENNAWILEMRVPKKALAPYSEEQWGFNFRRLQTRVNNAAYWSLPFLHDPTTFGLLDFQ
jgi:3',5'-cyclic AMP phosphodiesterase CpdA